MMSSKLSDALSKEAEVEEKAENKQPTLPNGWKIAQTKAGETEVKLKKTFGSEEVTVSFNIMPAESDNNEDQGEDEEEAEGQSQTAPVEADNNDDGEDEGEDDDSANGPFSVVVKKR